MAEHYLPAKPETVAWATFEAARASVLKVDSEDTVKIDSLSGELEDMRPADESLYSILDGYFAVHQQCERGRGPHFLNEPVWVNGAENDAQLFTMGFNPVLEAACKIARPDMLDSIEERAGWSLQDAYSLCSLAGDMGVTQLVNGHKVGHYVISKNVL